MYTRKGTKSVEVEQHFYNKKINFLNKIQQRRFKIIGHKGS